MNLTADIAAAGAFLKRVEHGAMAFLSGLEGAEHAAQQLIDSPAVQMIIAAVPQAKAALTVFEAQKALVDTLDSLVSAGAELPAALTQAHANLKAAAAVAPKTASPAP